MRTYAKVYLSLVFHNHQPVGNFDSVFAEGHDKSYLKLVELLERHPKIHVGMHFSGPLRDWIVANRPELFERARKLVERGQLEILGGGYYEPILVMLSDEDKVGQMKMLNEAVEKDFGAPPAGMWLAERVWEPSLAKPIAEAGLRYTIVDDTHLISAGWSSDELHGYFVTEEQGHTLNIFPTSTQMRYMLPWKEVPEIMSWLESLIDRKREGNPPLVFMGDDGEKFGLWPGTYERVWEGGYMDAFCEAVEAASEWLQAVTPTEYMSLFPALGRTYMPAASYLEMAEWSLPAEQSYELSTLRHQLEHELDAKRSSDPTRAAQLEAILRYLRGGFWRNFFVKYPEVNHMHKRGIFTSRRVN
ncbi:MAG: DUF1925 domain-containing protein, partial [Burkholderiales bacterium]|nr:DUF1925 domain-containing protein [Anaerolineae bacterium]